MGKAFLSRLLIIASESEQRNKLSAELAQSGFDCSVAPYNDKTIEQLVRQSFDLVLLNLDEPSTISDTLVLTQKLKQEKHIPIIALVSEEKLDYLVSNVSIDDFVVKPWNTTELIARIKRMLRHKGSAGDDEIINCGDLIIDSAKCEVSLCNEIIMLTFKEYQLLKFLANNQGKVFNRETLLAKVWGWDYYGGDRTVDVHIRRLRSKIEDRDHSFIDTVRNIGYRFKESI